MSRCGAPSCDASDSNLTTAGRRNVGAGQAGIGPTIDSVIKAVTRGTKAFTRVTGHDGVTRVALVEQRAA